MIGIFSRGMSKIPHLEVLVGDTVTYRPRSSRGLAAVAGWGHKPTADRARATADQWGVPYLAVEDGFLRSLGLGVLGHPPLSVVVDDLGIYYDATAPSRLERLIEAGGFSEDELACARQAMRAVVTHELSKYNHAPAIPAGVLPDNDRERVLLVDQTRNDASVALGGADAGTFADMLAAARREHPHAHLFVKVHPDVNSGKKRGYLSELDLSGVTVLDTDMNPMSLVKAMDRVYVVSSQLGFEALMAGCRVTCFGQPFYAGWGLTSDAQPVARRTAERSLEEVFAAAYIRYARYVDPYEGTVCGIMDTIDMLVDLKRHDARNAGPLVCAGFSWWRRGFAAHMFKSTAHETLFARSGAGAARLARERQGRVLVWSAKIPEGTQSACDEQGVAMIGVEDGFLRSTGLGSDFYWPYSLCVDTRGAYFDPGGPSDLEVLLQETDFDGRLLDRARSLRETIVGSGVTKYNVGAGAALPPFQSGGKRVALVVGQVADDKSVQLGGLGIHSDAALLQAVREQRPDAFIVYKPHPDVVSGNRKGGAFGPEHAALYDHMEDGVSLNALFPVVDELHTLTSLSGFEALLRGVPVMTYGGPFYAGWGLTADRVEFPRRNRTLSLDMLVAGVLILYPSYYDWRTEMFCGPEVVLRRLAAGEGPRQGAFRRNVSRVLQKILNIVS